MKAKAALVSFIFIVMLAGSSSSALAGCFFGCPSWLCFSHPCVQGSNFGNAFILARDGEILHPEAGRNLMPVTGLDGRAAENAMRKYIDSFSKSQATQAPGGLTSFAISANPGGYAP